MQTEIDKQKKRIVDQNKSEKKLIEISKVNED
jgi:hypothetical protein